VFDYLEQRLRQRWQMAQAHDEARAIEAQLEALRSSALYPDPDAHYVFECRYDLSALEPMVAQPHRVDNVAPISAVKGRPVHQAWLGTCTNGRLEDIAAACAVLRGRRVARTTRLLWTPASSEVLQEAMRLGYAAIFLEAGGVISTPGCGPCMGNHMGVPAVGEVTISSANRNFRRRMGTRDAEIYLASPAVVAASAVVGTIADPREVAQA
jgi:homoaconitase/3-isopropylmalate dehydratase large subunit